MYITRTIEKEIVRASRAIAGYKTEKYVVHLNSQAGQKEILRTVSPDIKAIPIAEIGRKL